MKQRVLRAAALAQTLSVSESTIWRWTTEGKFPKPIRLGTKTTVWDLDEVENFIEKQRAATA
jgi:prophage regulatory protein